MLWGIDKTIPCDLITTEIDVAFAALAGNEVSREPMRQGVKKNSTIGGKSQESCRKSPKFLVKKLTENKETLIDSMDWK